MIHSEYSAFKRRNEIWSFKLQHPQIWIAFQLPVYVGVGRGLVHGRGAAAAKPRRSAFRVAHLAQHHQSLAPSQHAKDAAAVGVAPAQHDSAPPGQVGQPNRHGHPNAGLHARFHALEGATGAASGKPRRLASRRALRHMPGATAGERRRGGAMDQRKMTEAQRAYEAKRAAKAGLTLERWLERKEKAAAAGEREAVAKQRPSSAEAKGKPGFLARLLEKAQKPL